MPQRLRWLLLLVALTTVIVNSVVYFRWTIDDAFITFRYAENLARGDGPVFNRGERVEGYTSFLWLILLAVGCKTGLPTLIASKILGIASTLVTVTLTAFAHRFSRKLEADESAVAAVLLASCSAFVQWTTGGMETPLVACTLLATTLVYLALLEQPTGHLVYVLALLGTLAVMSRPDAIVVIAVLGVHRIVRDVHSGERVAWKLALAFGVLYGTYFAWRLSYYGHLLPNTFYVKVGASSSQIERGIRYVVGAIPTTALLWTPPLLWFALHRESVRARDTTRLLALAIIVHVSYVVVVGGDNFPAHRFLTGVIPLLAIVASTSIFALASLRHRALVGVAIMLAYNLMMLRFDPQTYPRVRSEYVAKQGRVVGEWMRQNLPPGSLLATNAAGAVAYYSGLPIIDMLGLNDEHIAHVEIDDMGIGKAGHEKGDGAYVLSRKPDYIVFASSRGAKSGMFRGDKEIEKDEEFKERYLLETHALSDDGTLYIYRRLSDSEILKRKKRKKRKG